jgi:hypothetical protein
MLSLFVQLFGGHDSLATEVFLSLDGQAAKSAAISAAGASVLKDRDEEFRVLRAILAIAKSNEKDRNKLAHWTWGTALTCQMLCCSWIRAQRCTNLTALTCMSIELQISLRSREPMIAYADTVFASSSFCKDTRQIEKVAC